MCVCVCVVHTLHTCMCAHMWYDHNHKSQMRAHTQHTQHRDGLHLRTTSLQSTVPGGTTYMSEHVAPGQPGRNKNTYRLYIHE